jgi:hypothetical protein
MICEPMILQYTIPVQDKCCNAGPRWLVVEDGSGKH